MARVLVIEDGAQAFEHLRGTRPDLIVLDLMMPVLDGWAFIEAYRAIKVPCRVVSFEHDLVAPPAAGQELAAAIPGATHRTIPGCGHFGYLENPEAVNRELIRFLRAESRARLGETA